MRYRKSNPSYLNTLMKTLLSQIVSSIEEKKENQIRLLHQWCAINSGTTNLPGLSQMAKAIASAYTPLADSIEFIKLPKINVINLTGNSDTQQFGDALFIRKRPHLTRRVLLSGHMDTVYSATSPFQALTALDSNTLNGPGVADMKGGLIVMLDALAAFEACDEAHTMGWDVLINSDEEVGSVASNALLQTIAHQYQAALVYEPAMTPTGTIAKNRKGSGKFTLIAKGKAAHAGRDFHAGKNAICHLAKAILAVDKLNGQRENVTLNIGRISGGEALNVVPDTAVAQIDIRTNLSDDEPWVEKKLADIAATLNDDGYSLSVHGHFTRPVKRVCPKTTALFEKIQTIGRALGLTLTWQDSGGCCDGNNLAALGLPVIDTLGVRGGNIHSNQEYILLDSLTERTALSTLLLVHLAEGGLEELNHDAIS